jgi:protein phosphatase
MLVCPQCQFENPNTNKFCQRCGTSLTHKTCQECGTQVPLNAETCNNCAAFTGTVWWAIIAKDPDLQSAAVDSQEVSLEASKQSVTMTPLAEESKEQLSSVAQSELPQSDTSELSSALASDSSLLPKKEDKLDTDSLVESSPIPDEEPTNDDTFRQLPLSPLPSNLSEDGDENISGSESKDEESSVTPSVFYLDPQKRYRLLEPENLEKALANVDSSHGTSIRVLDSQPFQKSPLEALMEQQSDPQKLESLMRRDGSDRFSTIPSDSWKIFGIPAIAQPYIALHEVYYPTVPEVHDAWQQNGKAVVLLEDRSEWQLLSDLWGNEQLSTLQILYWLDEMAKLWEALEPWHCRQSLLEVTNLRVDEDQALGLVRLYPEAKEQQLTLQDLGQMWQMLFDQSQRTQFTTLGSVFRQMCTNEIDTVQKLRSQLEMIAHEQQSLTTAMTQYDDSTEPAEDAAATVAMKSAMHESSSLNDSDDLPTVILPMQLLSLDDAGCTDIGHQREHNEDSFGIQTQINKQETPMGRSVQARGLYVLCDGMGGHAAGEVASAMAVETLKRFFQDNWHDEGQLPTEDTIREAIRLTNQAIYDVNQKNARSGSGRMGTTLAMILIQNTDAVIAHVGDSRIYRLTRKRGLEQVTVDHEVGQREINRGVEPAIAYSRPDAYQLTQAIGPRGEQFINPDLQFMELNEDTLFVICSDGLSDNDLIETHWQTYLAPLLSSRANLDQGILQLIELANEHNGHDNITAILVRVKVRPNFEQQQLL